MFGSLDLYADEDYAREHQTLTYDLIQPDGSYERREFEVMAAFYGRVYKINETDFFRYYYYTDLSDPAVFQEYVDQVKAAALYDLGGGGGARRPTAHPVHLQLSYRQRVLCGRGAGVRRIGRIFDAVTYAYENGLMIGTSRITFSPNLTTKSAIIVTIFYSLSTGGYSQCPRCVRLHRCGDRSLVQ